MQKFAKLALVSVVGAKEQQVLPILTLDQAQQKTPNLLENLTSVTLTNKKCYNSNEQDKLNECMVTYHNEKRKLHPNTPSTSLDRTLKKQAQKWVEHLTRSDDMGNNYASPTSGNVFYRKQETGENFASVPLDRDICSMASYATDLWYKQISFIVDWSIYRDCKVDMTDSLWQNTRYFSNMLSPRATSMGCGLQGGLNGDVWMVCQYVSNFQQGGCPIPPIDPEVCLEVLRYTLQTHHPTCPPENQVYIDALQTAEAIRAEGIEQKNVLMTQAAATREEGNVLKAEAESFFVQVRQEGEEILKYAIEQKESALNKVHTEATSILAAAKAKAQEIMAHATQQAETMKIDYIHLLGGAVGDEEIVATDGSGCYTHPHVSPKFAPYECQGGFTGGWGQCSGGTLIMKLEIDDAEKCMSLCQKNGDCGAYHHVHEDGKWQCVTFEGEVTDDSNNKCSAHCCKK